jgi:hypothetical protein
MDAIWDWAVGQPDIEETADGSLVRTNVVVPPPKPPKQKVAMWKMKDGTRIAVKDMETSHIQNCIAMLQRSIVDPYQWGEPVGDAAHDAFEQGARQQEQMNDALRHNINIFKQELKKRGEK